MWRERSVSPYNSVMAEKEMRGHSWRAFWDWEVAAAVATDGEDDEKEEEEELVPIAARRAAFC